MTEPTAPIETHAPTSTTPTTEPSPSNHTPTPAPSRSYPRITIQYCTQCKWMLRAAYFAQELLSTFSTDIGEVALIPGTGGVFTVTIFQHSSPLPSASSQDTTGNEGTVLWDRKRDGGFPEVKMLKSLVRNVIDPTRDLGHTDRALRKDVSKASSASTSGSTSVSTTASISASASASASVQAGVPGADKACEDCQ